MSLGTLDGHGETLEDSEAARRARDRFFESLAGESAPSAVLGSRLSSSSDDESDAERIACLPLLWLDGLTDDKDVSEEEGEELLDEDLVKTLALSLY
jgi:hypothetical protein